MNDENLFTQFDKALQDYMLAAREYLDTLRSTFERGKPSPQTLIDKVGFFRVLDSVRGNAVSSSVQNLRMLAKMIEQQTERYTGEFYSGITDRLLDRRDA